MGASAEPHGGLAPLPTGLRALPSTEYWDETQWAVLFAILEAIMPAVAPESAIKDRHNQIRIPDSEFEAIFKRVDENLANPPSKEALREFLGTRCTADPAFIDSCKRMVSSFPPAKTEQLGGILKLLKYVCFFRAVASYGINNRYWESLTHSAGRGLGHASSPVTAPLSTRCQCM